MKHFIRLFCASLLLLAFGCGKKMELTQPGSGTIHGKLFGVIKIPRMDIPAEARPEMNGMMGEKKLDIGSLWVTISADSSTYEFRRSYPTDSLAITIGGRPAVVHPDGSFEASGVPAGLQEVSFIMRGVQVRMSKANIRIGDQDLTLEIAKDIDTCSMHSPGKPNGTQGDYPCLDNNGIGWKGFFFSDCFMSLSYAHPAVAWMCWSEAMNQIGASHGHIWCNGSRNCSLFVHCWNPAKQSWHRHYGPWIVCRIP